MAELGFIGLGIMGAPMAVHLVVGGNRVYVFNRSPGKVMALREKGAVACTNPKDVAEHSEIIFIMVPDTPDVEKGLFGPEGVTQGLRKGAIVVDMSSISPIETKGFARTLEAMGAEMLDAPVSGGQIGAENGTLSIMHGWGQTGDLRAGAAVLRAHG
jgi:2-hydroxy-3-oxopropionate reductase